MAVTTVPGYQIRSGTITDAQIASGAAIADTKLAVSYLKTDGSRALTGDWSAGNNAITNVKDAVSSQDAVNLRTAQALIQGLDTKASVRAATTANGTLATAYANGQAIDGVTLATNDRILIKDQTSATENGIYVVAASGAPSRAADADSSAKVTANLYVFVEEGTTQQDTGWTLTNNGAITLGSTSLAFTQFSGAGAISVGGGASLTKTGNVLTRSALTGDVTASADSNATTIAAAAVSLSKMANLAANSVIANNTGSGATPTALGLTAAPTASTVMLRDTNGNTKANAYARGVTTTATAAGTTTLTAASTQFQQFTGSTTQTVVTPDATTLVTGHSFIIANRSSGAVQVNANGGGALVTIAAGSQSTVTVITNGSAAGTWDATSSGGGSGTVTAVSVTTANGFAGSSGGGATPALTLSTTITGMLKGNGTAISAAAASTDYMAPSGFVDRETPTGTVNGSNVTFTLANTPLSGSEHVYLNGVLQEPGAGNDYTISTTTITYLTAPITGDKIRVSYRK